MTIKVTVKGDKLDLADEIADEFIPEAKAAAEDAADLVRAEVARLLTQRRGTAATAAPEGQPPEFDTGELLRGLRVLPARVRGRIVTAGVEVRHEGANRLEYGKTDVRGIRTLPHPFIRPAMAAMEGPVTDLLQERLG